MVSVFLLAVFSVVLVRSLVKTIDLVGLGLKISLFLVYWAEVLGRFLLRVLVVTRDSRS